MKDLFVIDLKDYDDNWPVYSRPSARAIIIKDDQVLLIYSRKYDYYKFPGGGIDKNETNIDALIREVKEETGYQIIPESIKEFGRVLRKQADSFYDKQIFVQENFYYLCDIGDEIADIKLDDYEKDEGFTTVWINPLSAAKHNHDLKDFGADKTLVNRDEKVLELLNDYLNGKIEIEGI